MSSEEKIKKILLSVFDETRDVQATFLISQHGLPIMSASNSEIAADDEGLLAAMAAAVQGGVEQIESQFNFGRVSWTILQATNGWILFKSGPELILAFQASKGANLGLLEIIMEKKIEELSIFFEY